MSDSVRPHRRQPTRLLRPWDSPGKNTGVGCHFLLQCMKVKSKSEVAQSCPTLATPWTAAYQAPPSTGFSRQKYWSGVPLPSPGGEILGKNKDFSDMFLISSMFSLFWLNKIRQIGQSQYFCSVSRPDEDNYGDFLNFRFHYHIFSKQNNNWSCSFYIWAKCSFPCSIWLEKAMAPHSSTFA